jgi:transcriptional regulator with XRE-family HTH domain
MHRLSLRLRVLRRKQGMTQAQLAFGLCVSPQYINDIEHGRRFVTPQLVAQLAHLFPADVRPVQWSRDGAKDRGWKI